MRTAIYPGSFDPLHEGHIDVIEQALVAFDKVIVAQGVNLEKNSEKDPNWDCLLIELKEKYDDKLETVQFEGLLVDFIKDKKINAIIRGLRNGYDLQYEMVQYYCNQDLGLKIPYTCFITDRKLSHISSSMKRQLRKLGVKC